MTIRIYQRVSTKGQSLDSQAGELEHFAAAEKAKGHQVTVYTDHFTGTSQERPAWKKLEKSLRAGDTLVVWRLDRLARNARNLLNLVEELQVRRVNLVSLRDAIDLRTASGRLFFNMLASVSQFESECRQERIASAIATKKARIAAGETGIKMIGRPKGSRTTLRPEKVAFIKNLKSQGKGVAEISRLCNLGRATIYTALSL